MNPWKPSRLEWISFFVIMPLLAFGLNYLLFKDRLWHDGSVWLYSYPIIYIQGLGSWYLHIVSMHWYRVIFPELKQTVLRLVLLAIGAIGGIGFVFKLVGEVLFVAK